MHAFFNCTTVEATDCQNTGGNGSVEFSTGGSNCQSRQGRWWSSSVIHGRKTRRGPVRNVSFRRTGDFGRRVCPFYNYFQPALVLLEDGALDAQAVLRVGADLVVAYTFNPEVLVASFDDLRRRGYLSKHVVDRISEVADTIEPSRFGQASGPLQSLVRAMEAARADLPDQVEIDTVKEDYLTLFAKDRGRARAAKRRVLWTRDSP